MTNLEKIVKNLLKELPIGGGYVAHVVKVRVLGYRQLLRLKMAVMFVELT